MIPLSVAWSVLSVGIVCFIANAMQTVSAQSALPSSTATYAFLAPRVVQRSSFQDFVTIEFEKWMQMYGKQYSDPAEKQRRKECWVRNRELDVWSVRMNPDALFGASGYSDMCEDELQRLFPPQDADLNVPEEQLEDSEPQRDRSVDLQEIGELATEYEDLPTSIDYRNWGVVSKIKDQTKPNYCGSCWAHSAVANMETMYSLAYDHTPPPLGSEQILVDCCVDCWSNKTSEIKGCDGGAGVRAVKWSGQPGRGIYISYPAYTGLPGACLENNTKYNKFLPISKKYKYFGPNLANGTSNMTKSMDPGVLKKVTLAMETWIAKVGSIGIAVHGPPGKGLSKVTGIVTSRELCPTFPEVNKTTHLLSIIGYGEQKVCMQWKICENNRRTQDRKMEPLINCAKDEFGNCDPDLPCPGPCNEDDPEPPKQPNPKPPTQWCCKRSRIVPYWILRNTVGADWGTGGYIRIERGRNLCMIETFGYSSMMPGYRVYFDSNGGSAPSFKWRDYEIDKKYEVLPVVVKEGWKFKGWYRTKTPTALETKITVDTKVPDKRRAHWLYARWYSLTPFDVKFSSSGASQPPMPIKVAEGEDWPALPTFSCSSVNGLRGTFAGWMAGTKQIAAGSVVELSGSTTLTPKCRYEGKVSFGGGGGAEKLSAVSVVVGEAYPQLPSLVVGVGQYFEGWTTTPGGPLITPSRTIVGSPPPSMLYAVIKNVGTVKVALNSKEGPRAIPSYVEVTPGGTWGKLPQLPSDALMRFLGWEDPLDGKMISASTVVPLIGVPSEVVARFERITTFVFESGSSSAAAGATSGGSTMMLPVERPKGEEVGELPSPVQRADATWVGWCRDEKCQRPVLTANEVVSWEGVQKLYPLYVEHDKSMRMTSGSMSVCEGVLLSPEWTAGSADGVVEMTLRPSIAGMAIQLNFMLVDIDVSPSCWTDFLTLSNGDKGEEPITVCATGVPEALIGYTSNDGTGVVKLQYRELMVKPSSSSRLQGGKLRFAASISCVPQRSTGRKDDVIDDIPISEPRTRGSMLEKISLGMSVIALVASVVLLVAFGMLVMVLLKRQREGQGSEFLQLPPPSPKKGGESVIQ